MNVREAIPTGLNTATSVYSVVITKGKEGMRTYEVRNIRSGERDNRELAADLIAAAYDLLKRLN
jgi:hypothetical protein